MIKRKLVFTLFLAANLAVSTLSDIHATEKDKSFYYDYGKQFYAEIHRTGSVNGDSTEALIMFRIVDNLMTFSKNVDPKTHKEQFVAWPKVYIDFRYGEGIIRKRAEWTDTVIVTHYDSTKSKTKYCSGYLKVVLPKGNVSVNVEFRNDQGMALKKEKLELEDIRDDGKPSISRLILAGGRDASDNSTSPVLSGSVMEAFSPFLLGGNVDFRAKNARIISLVTYRNNYDSYNYQIEYLPDPAEKIWDNVAPQSGQVHAERGSIASVFRSPSKEDLYFSFRNEKGPVESNTGLVNGYIDIPLPAAFMYPGNYRIKIYPSDRAGDTLAQNFKVEWVDMPVSLRNPDYAAEMMYYTLTDAEYEEISDGDKTEVLKKIWKYWLKNDPTKYTVYNEAMAEYYKRVDYAFFNFQTINEKDGAKTDRGKIYILKGPPTDTERKLETDKTVEEWKYKNLKQVYVFETNASGRFKLKKINSI